jgi:hypothetical protein
MQVDLTREEISAIAEDQEAFLQSIHSSQEECEDMAQCPVDHFDNEDGGEVLMRQTLIKKLDTALGKKT